MRAVCVVGFVLGMALGLRGAVDVNTPSLQAVRKDFLARRDALQARRVEKLQALFQARHTAAEQELESKKRTGNISGMAVARKAIAIYATGLEQLEADGTLELPGRVRRELRATIDVVRSEVAAIDTAHAAALAEVRAAALERFTGELRGLNVNTDDDAAVAEQFDLLIAGPPVTEPEAEASAAEPGAPAETPPGAPGEAGEAPETPAVEVVATQSDAALAWATIARWEAAVANIEVVEFSVLERAEPEEQNRRSMITGQPFTTRYQPVRVLPPGSNYVFRLKAVKGAEAPTVVQWPQRRNRWTFMLRVRPQRRVPSRHAVDIQVSYPGALDLPVLSGQEDVAAQEGPPPSRATGPKVTIPFASNPAAAVIYVNGRPYRKGRQYVRTPAELELNSGLHDIVLRKFGYFDARLPDFKAAEGVRVDLVLQKDPNITDETARVSARNTWQSFGIHVKKGDRIVLETTGKWSCGAKRELVGPDGYPNNQQFYRYYVNPQKNPRLTPSADYGALLMRIGKDGPIRRVGARLKMESDGDGLLLFDINEGHGATYRHDNRGALTVRVRKVPPR